MGCAVAADGTAPRSTPMTTHIKQPPKAVGLYDPRFEHDACGVGMVARLDNRADARGDRARDHGAREPRAPRRFGRDPCTGDGAGILTQMPDELLRAAVDFELPAPGRYGVLMVSCRRSVRARRAAGAARADRARGGPDAARLARGAGRPRAHRRGRRRLSAGDPPAVRRRGPGRHDQDAFERKLYVIRRVCELRLGERRAVRRIELLAHAQLQGHADQLQLADSTRPARRAHQERAGARALALLDEHVPQLGARPPLPRDLPQRRDQHGDGQRQLDARARVRAASELFGEDLRKILPVVPPGNSDSATFDNVLELLLLAGRSLPHAAMMMIPEAYRDREDLPEDLKAFYAYHSCLMEPWDGPASVAFTDGRVVGAMLDRNGLRPGRWVETTDGHVVLGSETGMLDVAARRDQAPGAAAAGQAVPRGPGAGPHRRGRARSSAGLHAAALPRVVRAQRGGLLRARALRTGDDLRPAAAPAPARVRLLPGGPVRAAGADGARRAEPIGSMGNDLSLAVLSDQAPPLFSYFKQLFAQVTNPPIDPIREEIVMSLETSLGSERNLFDETPEHAHKLRAGPADPAQPEPGDAAPRRPRGLLGAHDRHNLADRRGPAGDGKALARVCAEATRRSRARQHHRPLRPPARAAPCADPLAAGRGRGAPSPRTRGHAPARRHRPRVRRAARGAPLRDADQLRRERDQPLPDARDARRARAARSPGGRDVRAADNGAKER